MYAIIFELDQAMLDTHKVSYTSAMNDIDKIMNSEGFVREQSILYFGSKKEVNVIDAILAFQKLSREYSWFTSSVKKARLLRIAETSSLMPAILK